MQISNLPAISGLDDARQGRVVLYQSGRLVHAPITKVGLQISSKLLDAIAGLTGAADKGIYFTGTDTAATFDLTSFARSLLDDADAATMRGTLGLGTAATTAATDYATAAQGAKADSAVQPGSLATVATSGAYGDLSGKPALGTAAARDTGTSGANVPLLNANNTNSGTNTFSGITHMGAQYSATGANGGWTHRAIDGVVFSSREGSSNLAHHLFYNTNGAVGNIATSGSATIYATSSDETLKDFIGPYDPAKAIAIIRADPVRDFTWKADGSYAVGWGAQTSYAVSHDLAAPGQGEPGDEDYIPWGVDQSRRTPYLWAALSWALDKIDDLEARLAALEA